MKKLYRKGTVHPSPPVISDQLSFLPATILTLTAALSPEDREVLAYLISCSSNNNFSGNPRRNTNKNNKGAASAVPKGAVDSGDHAPLFHCSCFRCYMSYWVRWDSSPNRQLIHEIIDAFEDWLAQQSNKGGKNGNGGRKEKRNNKKGSNKQPSELNGSDMMSSVSNESGESESVGESSNSGGGGGDGEGGDGVEDEEKGSVRRLVSFIGEKIWGAWGTE